MFSFYLSLRNLHFGWGGGGGGCADDVWLWPCAPDINKEQLLFLSFSFSTTYTWTLKTAKAYRDQTMGIRTSFNNTLNLFIWRSYAFKSNVESSGAVKSSKFI